MPNTQIVCITHIRCSEYTATTYVCAPQEWSQEIIEERIRLAQQEYLAATAVVLSAPPNNYRRYGSPPFTDHPTQTVQWIIDMWQEKKKEWDEWNATQNGTTKRFSAFLTDQGFLDLYDQADIKSSLDWGHLHGVNLNYGETDLDTMPTAKKLVLGDEYDEEDWL